MFLDQASALYERATTGLLKKSMLLYFAYADFEEQQMKLDKVHQIYLKYLEIQDIDPTLVSLYFKVNYYFAFHIFIWSFFSVLYSIHEVLPKS